MQKGVIIVNAYTDVQASVLQAERMKEELLGLHSDVYIYKNNGYNTYLDGDGKILSGLSDIDYAVFFDKDKYLPRMLEGLGVRVFNNSRAIELCDDKMTTHLALAGAGIKMPVTLPAPLCYTPSAEIDAAEADKVIAKLGLPVIVKESFGSLGKGVFLIKTREELLAKMNELKTKAYIFQQFIASSYGRDVRIIVIGGKAYSAMLRRSETDFRSNIDLGGKGFAVTPPDSFIKTAETAAHALNLDYCGVDVLFGENDEPCLCEVNSNAFFKEMERITGKNVAGAYAKHILQAD